MERWPEKQLNFRLDVIKLINNQEPWANHFSVHFEAIFLSFLVESAKEKAFY